MASPAADPTGVVAGFADATERFLPLAFTLNATLAVARMAAWLGIARDDVEPSGGVVVMPYLDGERTPNLPQAAGTIAGLRHSTTPVQILMTTYEGAVLSLIDALDRLAEQGSGIAAEAPLVLIGGGARGRTWREVLSRLSGRELLVPAADELVALGAAAQAGSLLTGEAPEGWRAVGIFGGATRSRPGLATRQPSTRTLRCAPQQARSTTSAINPR